jgi:replication-associated recombination protein RarA
MDRDAQEKKSNQRPYRQSWYQLILHQFNKEEFDYGAWMEERRRLFLEATSKNPYFSGLKNELFSRKQPAICHV